MSRDLLLEIGTEEIPAAFFPDALAPAGETGGIQRRFGLEVSLTGEVLDVGVLDPGVDDDFIGAVISVLQVKQSGNEPGAQCWSAGTGYKVRTEGAFNLFPVDDVSEFDQRMFDVNHLKERLLKQRAALWHYLLWTHKTPALFARFRYGIISFLANSDSRLSLQPYINTEVGGLFSTDSLADAGGSIAIRYFMQITPSKSPIHKQAV